MLTGSDLSHIQQFPEDIDSWAVNCQGGHWVNWAINLNMRTDFVDDTHNDAEMVHTCHIVNFELTG